MAHRPALGVAHFTAIDVPPLDFVALAAQSGYTTVGLRLHPAFPGAPFYEVRVGSSQMRDLRNALVDTGLRVYDIEFVVIDASFSAGLLKGILESAAALGARRLSVCGDDPDHPRLVANYAALCELAGSFGLGVDIENMPWRHVATIADAARVVAEAQCANGGILVDALHLARCGASPADLRAFPKAMIRSAQLCDAIATRPGDDAAIMQEARGGRLLPGQGALPLQALLLELPYEVALSVEVPNRGTPAREHLRAVYEAAVGTIQVSRAKTEATT